MESSEQPFSLRQVWLVFRRRWRVFAFVCTIALAVTAIYTFTAPRLYRPQASLEIRPEASMVASRESDGTSLGPALWEQYYQTQQSILHSPALLETTLQALPPNLRREFEVHPNPIEALLQRIELEKVRMSFILKIGVVDTDPERATQVLNTLVSVYLDDANRRYREVRLTTAEALSKETLPGIRKKVDEASAALQEFQSATGFIDFEERNKAHVENWRKIDAQTTEVRLRRASVGAELESIQGTGAEGLGVIFHPAFHKTRMLESLVQERARITKDLAGAEKELKEHHPKVIELRAELASTEEKMREAIASTLASLQTDLAATEKEEQALTKQREEVERHIAEVGGKLAQHRRLEAELDAVKDLYSSYLKMQGEKTATSGMGLASVRIIDHARVPSESYKPNARVNFLIGGCVGLFLGVLAMFMVDHFKDGLFLPDEIRAFVGLDVLGVIPRIRTTDTRPLVMGNESSKGGGEVEAFRTLRTQVVSRLEKLPGAKVLAVLSPHPSEGKTTVTVNLAHALALEGRRVLLFDADLRKPQLLKLLCPSEEGVGIEGVLRGEVTLEQAVRHSKIPLVDVLGTTSGLESAAELASSPRCAEALRLARERYDIVLLDTAPVKVVSESVLVARRADAAILVFREGQTTRGIARQVKRELEEVDVKILGAVLNVAVSTQAGYGYYYYYSSKHPEEAPREVPQVPVS